MNCKIFLLILMMSMSCCADTNNIPATFGKTHFIVGRPASIIPGPPEPGPSVPNNPTPPTPPSQPSSPNTSCAYFAPDDDLRSQLCTLIDREQKAIKVAIYMFTDHEIAQALARAQKRGVAVEMVTDVGCLRERRNKIGTLCDAGCSVYVYNPAYRNKDESGMMHDKFVVFGSQVWTGSFNFTRSGVKTNQENAVVLADADVIKKFSDQFERLKQRSYKYGKATRVR